MLVHVRVAALASLVCFDELLPDTWSILADAVGGMSEATAVDLLSVYAELRGLATPDTIHNHRSDFEQLLQGIASRCVAVLAQSKRQMQLPLHTMAGDAQVLLASTSIMFKPRFGS